MTRLDLRRGRSTGRPELSFGGFDASSGGRDDRQGDTGRKDEERKARERDATETQGPLTILLLYQHTWGNTRSITQSWSHPCWRADPQHRADAISRQANAASPHQGMPPGPWAESRSFPYESPTIVIYQSRRGVMRIGTTIAGAEHQQATRCFRGQVTGGCVFAGGTGGTSPDMSRWCAASLWNLGGKVWHRA